MPFHTEKLTYLLTCVKLLAFKESMAKYIHFYNSERFHQSLGYETPAARVRSPLGIQECNMEEVIRFKTLDKWAHLRPF
ncbi:hypothetical protein SPIRO4BDMA_50469 [uncultured spirochete]|uniref:Integrase catalytic domain-containing protein n=1 Tax=uncultured spirochete TaxID=156406 RepID=A0A3P3XS14_9SPIR|nr:hypothetical protein SPIRO4BDMA_50469 [uncultured spirochete]